MEDGGISVPFSKKNGLVFFMCVCVCFGCLCSCVAIKKNFSLSELHWQKTSTFSTLIYVAVDICMLNFGELFQFFKKGKKQETDF